MQEIEVPPRDVFQHYVHVDQPGKTLVWWFSTKKKNISFGLFARKSSSTPAQLRSNTQAPSIVSTARTPSIMNVSRHQTSASTHSNSNHSTNGNNGNSNGSILNGSSGALPTKPYAASSRASIDTTLTSDEEHAESISDNVASGLPGSSGASQSSNPPTSQPSRKKKPTTKLGQDLVEIMPIQHYDSGSGTIRGEFTVQEEGTYVLLFDNSFSINTSKRLTFFVALEERGTQEVQQQVLPELSGWLLKKKRKRMQGWAKRWFQIDNGVLSYYKVQNGPCRGKVHLVLSTVTVSQASNMIHIDSGTMLYHLKALSVEDYSAWTKVIKAFKSAEQRVAQETVHRLSRHSTQRNPQLRTSWTANNQSADQIKDIMAAMDSGFQDIKDQLDAIRPHPETAAASGASKDRERQSSVTDSNNSKFKLRFGALQRTNSDASIASSNSLESVHARLQASITKLKADKDQVFELMRTEMAKWEKNEKQYRLLMAENDTLSKRMSVTVESSTLPRRALEEIYLAHSRNSMASERTNSMTSSIHTGSDVFFDAEDAVLSTNMSSTDLSDLEASFDGEGDHGDDDNSSDDEVASSSSSVKTTGAPSAPQSAPPTPGQPIEEPIVRRSVLPAPVSGENISLLSILRKNVGKDLSTVAMPVSLNEPINVLQRLCEELEYSELLDKAVTMNTSMDRLVYVAAFAVSGYATSQWRASRKPFNPLLGETFEYVCPEKGFKFISEKVSHYPPVMACHAESANHWSLSMDSRAKTKFWGKSMELIPNGTIHIEFSKTGDHYTITKPSTWMRNLMAGTKYLDHTGDLKVVNHTTKETCVLTFKESSYFSSTKNEIVGHVMNAQGAKKRTLQGRWNESLMEEVAPNQLERLWKCNTPPPNHEKYYGFTAFTMHLNELTKGLEAKLPRTDTRFRPDQSLFERGKVEEADKEKLRVEQKQRETRKAMEQSGTAWEVRWFEKKPDPQTEDPEGQTWRYKGGYWESREKGQWNEKVAIW